MQCDAPSLYASVKVALAKAWIPSTGTTTTNYNQKKKNNSNNTENDIFENIAVL
jgi:hypothetical protein